jgi:tRNA(Ile)-lysidine synthase
MYPLETKLADAWPPSTWADVTVLVAVSGGADSVALLRAMATLKTGGDGRLCAAHLNHRLRPDADADQQFVVDLCGRLNVACEVGHVDVKALAASGGGIEAAARAARHRFFEQAAGRLGARFVATAHTADDQAETVLHRIVRGTGIRGLAGMARARPLGHAVLIRPLLGIRRAELAAYLDAIGQPHRHDESNLDPRFTRNRIRHQLLPRLQKHFNAEVVEALLRLGALAGEAQAVIDDDVDAWFDRCVTMDRPDEVCIELALLAARPRYIIRELLMALWRRSGWPMQSMGMLKWDELCDLATLDAAEVKRVFPGNITVEVADGQMRLRRRQ